LRRSSSNEPTSSPSSRKRARPDDDDGDKLRVEMEREARRDDRRGSDRDRDRDRYDDRDRDRDRRDRDRDRYDDRDRRDRYDDRRDYDRDRRDRYDDRDRRDRFDDRDRRDRDDRSRLDEEPILHKVYSGKVASIKEFGAFVSLEGIRGKRDGLVHISELSDRRVGTVEEVVQRGQPVKVKVKSIAGNRISLTMKEVDQTTGRDLYPAPKFGDFESSNEFANPSKPSVASRLRESLVPQGMIDEDDERKPRRPVKRMTSPEIFEAKQLMASGVVPITDMPNFDDEHGLLTEVDEDIQDVEIELNEDEPNFLKGQMGTIGQLSPVKIVKAPEGSLQRAATTSSALAKERRELREQQRHTAMDSVSTYDALQQWEDPMAKPDQRQLVADLRAAGASSVEDLEMPEWKRRLTSGSKFGRIASKSIKEQRENLPIFKLRDKLLQAVHDNQILIVVGETGSGKTTQITQYLAEAGYSSKGKIGCTQPRRVAATSVAKRVSDEVGCRLGEDVGYAIRFEDVTSPQTTIKYMTDGMLLRECLVDADLLQYSVIILDEAHERNIHTDVLMGLLKQTTLRRKDLKLIVTSATLDADKFSTYFRGCPIFTIPGRTYPVDTLYTRDPESDYLDAALITVMQIHLSEPPGDVLVFLTGQEEIDTACQILYDRMKALGPEMPELIILPIYSALPSEMQSRIFEAAPPGARKCIIGTNIAETSVTIDGIYYVVDPGFVKQKVYSPKTGMDALVVCPISKAQAKQRAGRAGRTGPGKCYRLYTESAYKNEMLDSPIPEIQRVNLATTVLHLKALGINDLLNFDFMDKPSESQLISAMHMLYSLGALDDEGLLTRLGRKMAEFPLEPQLAKVLLTSVELGCAEELLTIVAMLSVQNVFYRPKDKQTQADQRKAKFHQPEGDHLTILTVYEAWKAAKFSNPWCYENFIQARSMRRAQDVRKQLLQLMDRYKLDVMSCGKNYNKVRKALVSGFFVHAARKDPQEGYKTIVEGTPVYIHPASALFHRDPPWVIYHELVQTTKEYMREVTAIEANWLVEFAPKFFKSADPNKMTKRKRQERLEPLFNKFEKADEWRISKRPKRR